MIRFGVIGTNFITDQFLEAAMTLDEFCLTAVYSRRRETGMAFAAKYQAAFVYDSLEELAESGEVDAVYLASPTSLHYTQAILMLNNGKHVLCEKPVCSNQTELTLLLEAAEANHVVFLEAMRPAFMPATALLEQVLPRIGPVRHATLSYCQYSSRYDKFKAGIVENAFNPKFSNGAIMDIGVYVIYMMLRLFGAPKEIKAAGVTLENGVNGSGTILAAYEGMTAEVLFSKITEDMVPSQIQGEWGNLMIDKACGPASIRICCRDGQEEQIPVMQREDDMVYEAAEMIRLIKEQETGEEYHRLSRMEMEVLDEARRQMGIEFPADRITMIL